MNRRAKRALAARGIEIPQNSQPGDPAPFLQLAATLGGAGYNPGPLHPSDPDFVIVARGIAHATADIAGVPRVDAEEIISRLLRGGSLDGMRPERRMMAGKLMAAIPFAHSAIMEAGRKLDPQASN